MKHGKIQHAVRVLRRGGVIIFPTETAYGIGCDATNAAAVRRIYRIKGRGRGKQLPVIAADLRQARRFFRIDGVALRLALRHWPGPLTVVVPAGDARIRRAVGENVGVRVSSHRIPRALAARLGRPIVATSANRSGGPTCYSVACVRRQLSLSNYRTTVLQHYALTIIDAGPLPRRKPSTVIKIVRGRLRILRPGPIDPTALPHYSTTR